MARIAGVDLPRNKHVNIALIFWGAILAGVVKAFPG
jgi:ribosomal protein S13